MQNSIIGAVNIDVQLEWDQLKVNSIECNTLNITSSEDGLNTARSLVRDYTFMLSKSSPPN